MRPDQPLAILGGLTIEAFLRDYWQKKPLFVKNAMPAINGMISPDELAGLSLEEDVESRIIQEQPDNQWSLDHGPFPEDHFSTLPESHWTLIVQAVDQHIPEFSQLLSQFDFIPSWRLDDIMITYATDQGSVGPHYDYYDVFLIQAEGHRQWQVGQHCDENSEILPELPVKVLEQFDVSNTWNVEPGDLLYLPPGLAHHGVANGECMTMSVGFRAPSNKDMLSAYTDFQLDALPDNQRYADPDLLPQSNAGWISPTAIQQVKERLLSSIESPGALQNWFGQYMSAAKYDDQEPNEDNNYSVEDILSFCESDATFIRDESSRLAYYGNTPNDVDSLFVNGVNTQFPNASSPLVRLCCHARTLPADELASYLSQPQNLEFFLFLVNQGVFYPQ
ncbi:hypothetical protein A9Q99_19745 [Gammaproteobacteria bacterium 45_16_T64]|nr:hypothetical protein A9Q99_19745 [Gammaproteobacteria bacterium 45_16_T64]